MRLERRATKACTLASQELETKQQSAIIVFRAECQRECVMLKAVLSSTQHSQQSDAVLQSLHVVSQKVIFGNNQLQYISPFCQFFTFCTVC